MSFRYGSFCGWHTGTELLCFVYRKPLILKGVRQVGKTWILKEFGKRYYDNTAYFNFDENEEYKQFFETTKDVNRILQNLMLASGQKIVPDLCWALHWQSRYNKASVGIIHQRRLLGLFCFHNLKYYRSGDYYIPNLTLTQTLRQEIASCRALPFISNICADHCALCSKWGQKSRGRNIRH